MTSRDDVYTFRLKFVYDKADKKQRVGMKITRRAVIETFALGLAAQTVGQLSLTAPFLFSPNKSSKDTLTYKITCSLNGFSQEEFNQLRPTWEDAKEIEKVNFEFQERGLLVFFQEGSEGDKLTWEFNFSSHSALEEWRQAILSHNLIKVDKVPAQIKYEFTIS